MWLDNKHALNFVNLMFVEVLYGISVKPKECRQVNACVESIMIRFWELEQRTENEKDRVARWVAASPSEVFVIPCVRVGMPLLCKRVFYKHFHRSRSPPSSSSSSSHSFILHTVVHSLKFSSAMRRPSRLLLTFNAFLRYANINVLCKNKMTNYRCKITCLLCRIWKSRCGEPTQFNNFGSRQW